MACCFATTFSREQPRKRAKLQTEHDMSKQLPLQDIGHYVTVRQKRAAGFFSEESLLYVRQESVDLWNTLNSSNDNNVNLVVDGPPGSGKSTEVWAWALWKAQRDKLQITWYHITKCRMVKVLIDGTTTNKIITGYTARIDNIEHSEGSILIVDGVTSSIHFDVSVACQNWCVQLLGRRFISVSSVSVNVPVQETFEANIVVFTVGSWTLAQYQAACENDQFFNQVVDNLRCPGHEGVDDKDQLLLAKYYFAGGCARWMFEFSFNTFRMDFDQHLEQVWNYNYVLRGGGNETVVAVNHLRSLTMVQEGDILTKKYFFISQYVVEELAKKCHNKRKFLIESYKVAAATKNPAFEGWIFKLDMDYQLGQAWAKKENFHTKMCTVPRPLISRPDCDNCVLLIDNNDQSVDTYVE